MAKAKREPFVIKSGNETILFEATPREAARKVVREARGTFDRTKRYYEQSEGAHTGRVATLMDPSDTILMRCRPTLLATRHRTAKNFFASCEIKPQFKKRLVRKRRRK